MALADILNRIRSNAKQGQQFAPGANLPTPKFIQDIKGSDRFRKITQESPLAKIAQGKFREVPSAIVSSLADIGEGIEKDPVGFATGGAGPLGIVGSLTKKGATEVAKKAFNEGLKNASEEALYKARQIALREKAKLSIPGPKGFGQKVKEFFEPIKGVDKETQSAYREWTNKRLSAKTLANEDLTHFESGKIREPQLEPLAEEVRKYKSAEELGKNFDSFLKIRIPEIQSIKNDKVMFKNGQVGSLAVDTAGGDIHIVDIALDKKGTGLGTKIVRAIKDFGDLNMRDIKVIKPYNTSFWKKFGVTEEETYLGRVDFQKGKQIKSQLTDLYNQTVKGEAKPTILPKPAKQAFPPDLEEKITAFENAKQLLVEDPARQLVKYANKRTGELPEVLGQGGKFAKTGDELAGDLGFADSEAAREAYQVYLKKAQKLKTEGIAIRNQKNLFRDEHELNKFLNIDETVLSSKRTLEFKPKKFVDEEGFQAIKDYQAGKSTPYVERIKLAFDDLFKEANKRGLEVPYRERYLPQVYANTPAEIQEATLKYMQSLGVSDDLILDYLKGKELPRNLSQSLKLNPFFSKSRLFPDYETAMKFGLTPRYTNPAQLVAHYRKELEETLANKEFLETLLDKGKLLPEQMAPKHYQPIAGNNVFKGYHASPELKKIIESKFRDEEALGLGETLIKSVAWASKRAQEIALSAGIPKTSFNFFSIGQLVKQMTAGDFKSGIAFIRSNFNGASIKYFQNNQNYMSMMARQGLDLGNHIASYDKVYANLVKNKNWVNKFGREFTFDKVFNEKTFQSFMPQLHIQNFKDAYKKGLLKGMNVEQAEQFAARTTRAMFGLFEDVGRGQGFKDAMSAAFFAPQFREGVVRTLFNTLKSVTSEINNPAFYKNRQLLAGMVLTYGAYNALNKKLSGHFMWDNPRGKEFALMIPTQSGEVVYVEFMPSFLAFARNMIGVPIALVQGDTETAGRKFGSLFSMPLKIASEVLSNQNYFGRPIYNEYDSFAKKSLKIARYIGLESVGHPYVKELVYQVEDKKPLHQSVVAALELPLKFSSMDKISQQKFYDALDKKEKGEAKVRDKIKAVYAKIQELKGSGQEDETLKLYDTLSEEEKVVYKNIKTADKRRQTQKGKAEIYDLYLKIQQLKQEGRTEEALEIHDSLSDDEKRHYKLVKSQFKGG
jgi:multimeric flavodoxin WrbA